MDALRVVIGLDTFWHHIRSMKKLGHITRTCKTLRRECDPAYAVACMGKDRAIIKAWALRWLGLSGWRFPAGPITLISALRMAAGLGGLAATCPRAIRVRAAEDARKAAKTQERDRALYERRTILDARLREKGVLTKGYLYRLVLHSSIPITAAVVDEIRRSNLRDKSYAQKRVERKKAIDRLLRKETLTCSGYFYDKCVWDVSVPIDADMIHTLRLSLRDSELEQVVRHLRERKGHFFQGIYARARELIAEGVYVNDDGLRVWRRWEWWTFHDLMN